MRIAIVGHAASPDRGSEPGVTWNWAWYLSQHHDVWLVNYPEFRDEVDAFLATHSNERLHIVWTQNQSLIDPWKPTRSTTGPRFKIHYLLWLAKVQKVVARLVDKEAIDIVHQVGLITVSAPSKLWQLPVPFIWGPVGGGETAPIMFRGYYGRDWRREQIRRWRIRLIGRSTALRRTVTGSRYVFAVNWETQALLERVSADSTRLKILSDVGVRPEAIRRKARSGPRGDELVLLWAGRLEARKALPILLDAMADLKNLPNWKGGKSLPVRLLVAGDGPKRMQWEQHAKLRGVNASVMFLGSVAPTRMAQVYEQADVFVFTSLQDAMGSVVLEALSYGLPAITLNHQGCASIISDDAAVKVPVTTPAETIRALAMAIASISEHPDELSKLSKRALTEAEGFSWPSRADAMIRVYKEVMASCI